MSAAVAEVVADKFRVEMRDVCKPKSGPTGFKQLMPEVSQKRWYDEAVLKSIIPVKHPLDDSVGSRCPTCSTWRWLPVSEGDAHIFSAALDDVESDVAASPEWFGSGWSSMRNSLFRRELAEALVASNAKHWSIVDVELV
ncbi:hypothetical protein [Mumia quercus]|uniref:hypothetical protein n=1 Tax=Mumia quercus TaxID=2976125 RepID=UPI0021D220DB|nr:hypothetical protein [Mumia quercus]